MDMLNVKDHLNMLGLRVEDRVTGFNGIVSSVGFDLYGCIQAIVNPGLGTDGKMGEQTWFDIARLRVVDEVPVMPRPDYSFGPVSEGLKGPAEKPRFHKA